MHYFYSNKWASEITTLKYIMIKYDLLIYCFKYFKNVSAKTYFMTGCSQPMNLQCIIQFEQKTLPGEHMNKWFRPQISVVNLIDYSVHWQTKHGGHRNTETAVHILSENF